MRLQRFLAGVIPGTFLLLAAIEQQTPLEGCAPAPRPGPGQWVSIRDESALIVWDAKSGTEHFVRRARFETQAEDFGFLVPTPTQPDLGEVDDRVFGSAGMITAPRHVYEEKIQTKFGFGFVSAAKSAMFPAAMRTADAMPLPSVQVLEQKEVAGFDATVLKADDVQALAEWLDKHGYESRPALTEWMKWYVDHHWIITAFKLTKGGVGRDRDSWDAKSLRMSFHADKPFYPYREPEDMRRPSGQGTRTLRVFFLADRKYEGTLSETGPWPGRTVWANDASSVVQNITSPLKLAETDFAKSLEGAKYLTEFEDRSFPRPGTDEVYFKPASDDSAKERPPIVHTRIVIRHWPGPWGLVGLVVGIVLLGAIVSWRVRMKFANAPVER